MGIPLCASIDAVPDRMVFRETKVIRTSFIQEAEPTGWITAPRERRNQIKSSLYFCSKRWMSLSVIQEVTHDSLCPKSKQDYGSPCELSMQVNMLALYASILRGQKHQSRAKQVKLTILL